MPTLKGKVALVTGGAQGIGKAIAKRFADEGAKVILTDIDAEKGAQSADDIGIQFLSLDVSLEKAWDKVMSQVDKLDILVNNAGITGLDMGPGDPENASIESWRKIHTVNLDSVFFGCKWAIRKMKEHGGSIINISSRSGMVGVPLAVAYASSKAAIRNHTKSVALYCAEKSYNIRCNSIHPGAIWTPLWEVMAPDEKSRAMIAEGVPLGRFGKPEEVAAMALYLASDESAYVTGAEFTIDGGILAGSPSAPGK